jgi:type IV pilus assembly protein PilP
MKIKSSLILLMIFISFLSLTSCSRGGRLSKLEAETKQLQEKINSQQPKIVTIQLPTVKTAVYDAEKWRDPFEMKQSGNDISGHPNSLKSFPLAMIRFIGVIEGNNGIWAVLITPDNHTFKVKAGDVIGNLNGKIVKISQDQIEVIETILDDQNHPAQRIVILPLKE